jgi:signal recognition particle receptor subunit beta
MATSTFTFKILVIGPFGVGKTSLIQQISEVPVVGTEVSTIGREAQIKATTTVGIEYGIFSIKEPDQEDDLLLFGTPGQDRFSDVREVAASGIDGLLILVDGNDQDTWPHAAELYRSFNPEHVLPAVVAVNRLGEHEESPRQLLDLIGPGPDVEIVHGDVIDANDARRFLIELLTAILQKEFDDDEFDDDDEQALERV